MLEYYVHKNQKKLRCGYTTGSCAALAAAGATTLLLRGSVPDSMSLLTPGGIPITADVLAPEWTPDYARCAIQKDSGDDPDVTNGMLVVATVYRIAGDDILIDGGQGVGRVTRRGLDQPVGAAAINRVPRRMIEEEVRRVLKEEHAEIGLRVEISIPGGEDVAKKTFNPRLGIEGGLSVLGTTGIVEPMSEKALVDSIRIELSRLRAEGYRTVVLTPGNYGTDFVGRTFSALTPLTVKCSNYLGETMDNAVELGFTHILLVGHIGKLVKLAAGIMNTHSRMADGRMEILTAHAALCGASHTLAKELMNCVTADEALSALQKEDLLPSVMESVAERALFHIRRRMGEQVQSELVLFSNEQGLLAQSPGADELRRIFLEELS